MLKKTLNELKEESQNLIDIFKDSSFKDLSEQDQNEVIDKLYALNHLLYIFKRYEKEN